jgi:hypothetical protein
VTAVIITADLLRSKGACRAQVARFVKLFPDAGVTVTRDLCISHADTFSWDWGAAHLLAKPARERYWRRVAFYWRTAGPVYSASAAGAVYRRLQARAFAEAALGTGPEGEPGAREFPPAQ